MSHHFEIGDLAVASGKIGTVVGAPEGVDEPEIENFVWFERHHDKHRHRVLKGKLVTPTPDQVKEMFPKMNRRMCEKLVRILGERLLDRKVKEGK